MKSVLTHAASHAGYSTKIIKLHILATSHILVGQYAAKMWNSQTSKIEVAISWQYLAELWREWFVRGAKHVIYLFIDQEFMWQVVQLFRHYSMGFVPILPWPLGPSRFFHSDEKRHSVLNLRSGNHTLWGLFLLPWDNVRIANLSVWLTDWMGGWLIIRFINR